MELEHWALVLTFIGAAIGVFGKSFDPSRRSFRKLLPAGYLALAIALLGLVVTWKVTSTKLSSAKAQANERQEARMIGILRLQTALDDLFEPAIALKSSQIGTRYLPDPADWFDMPLEFLEDADFNSWLGSIKLSDEVTLGPEKEPAGYSWEDLFRRRLERGTAGLDRALSIYGAVLPAEVVLEAELLRNSNYTFQVDRLEEERETDLDDFLRLCLFQSDVVPRLRKLTNLLRQKYKVDVLGPQLGLFVTGKFTRADEEYRSKGGSITEFSREK